MSFKSLNPFYFAALALLAGCTSAAGSDGGETIGRRILPGQALATFVPGSAAGAQQLRQLTLHLIEPAQEGRLRLRLVNAVGASSGVKPHPGTTDLLPAPLALSVAQLAETQGKISLPLGAVGVGLPKEGLFLVVECRATNQAEQRVAVTVANKDTDQPLTEVVLSRDPDNLAVAHVLPAAKFPSLLAQYGGRSNSITYLQADSTGEWLFKNPPATLRIEPEFYPQ